MGVSIFDITSIEPLPGFVPLLLDNLQALTTPVDSENIANTDIENSQDTGDDTL